MKQEGEFVYLFVNNLFVLCSFVSIFWHLTGDMFFSGSVILQHIGDLQVNLLLANFAEELQS